MPPQLRAVAYLRVSTTEQHLGPEAQRAAVEAWAKRSNARITSWHIERLSGRRPWRSRPGLVLALDAAQRERASVLVVARRDRIGRKVLVTLEIETELARRGLRLVSAAGEGTDGEGAETSTARLASGISDLLAEVEVLAIRERTRAALAVLKAQGRRYGQVPLGMRDEGGFLRECPEEKEVMAKILAMRAKKRSLRGIVLALKKSGHISRSGRPYSLSTVANVCKVVQASKIHQFDVDARGTGDAERDDDG